MIVLVAEAAEAVEEALADNVAGGVFAPPVRVTAGDDIRLRPTDALRLCVEESRPVLAVAVAARTAGRGTHPRKRIREEGIWTKIKNRKQKVLAGDKNCTFLVIRTAFKQRV